MFIHDYENTCGMSFEFLDCFMDQATQSARGLYFDPRIEYLEDLLATYCGI